MQRPRLLWASLRLEGCAMVCPDCHAPVVAQHRDSVTGGLDGVQVFGVHGHGFVLSFIPCGLHLWDRVFDPDTGAHGDYGARSWRRVLLPSSMLHGIARPPRRFVNALGIRHTHPSARCGRLIDIYGDDLSDLYATWVQGDRPKPDRYWAWRGADREGRCPGPDCPKLELLNLKPAVGGPREAPTMNACPYMG